MGLTPADVHNVAFSKPPIGKRGYNEDEVDAFLDLIEAELARLIEENNDLRAQNELLDSQLGSGRAPEPANRFEGRHLNSVPAVAHEDSAADMHVQAAKVLGLAQEMADRLTGEAKAESDSMLVEARTKSEQLLSEARAKADSMVNEARTRAETMINDARTRAETLERQAREKASALERDAQTQYSEVIGSITQEKQALEKKLETLRTFEREYRTRLKTFLESRLQELIDQGSAAPAAEGRANQSGYTFSARAAEAG